MSRVHSGAIHNSYSITAAGESGPLSAEGEAKHGRLRDGTLLIRFVVVNPHRDVFPSVFGESGRERGERRGKEKHGCEGDTWGEGQEPDPQPRPVPSPSSLPLGLVRAARGAGGQHLWKQWPVSSALTASRAAGRGGKWAACWLRGPGEGPPSPPQTNAWFLGPARWQLPRLRPGRRGGVTKSGQTPGGQTGAPGPPRMARAR